MSEVSVETANERCKAIAGIMFNLGTALIAAIVARIYTEPHAFDVTLLVWCADSAALIWVGWMVLSFLEAE